MLADQERWSTTAVWTGAIASVEASSSQSDADAAPPIERGSHPGAALDGDRTTWWSSDKGREPVGQWWQVDFTASRTVPDVVVTMPRSSAAVEKLKITMGGQSVVVPAPRPGFRTRYPLDLPAGSSLRITAAGSRVAANGAWQLAEVDTGVPGRRVLALPTPPAGHPVDSVVLSRDVERSACVTTGRAFTCLPALRSVGEDGDRLERRFDLPASGSYDVTAKVSLRRSGVGSTHLLAPGGARVDAELPTGADVAARAVAMVDGDPGTTWVGKRGTGWIEVAFPKPTPLREVRMLVSPDAQASRPQAVVVSSGKHRRTVQLDSRGHARLPGWSVRRVRFDILSTKQAYVASGSSYTEAPVGVSTLEINGSEPGRLTGGEVHLRCGEGPTIQVAGQSLETALDASVSDLLRGRSVDARVCGSAVDLRAGEVQTSAAPAGMLRVDRVVMTRPGAEPAAPTTPVALRRDDRGMPVATTLDAAPVDRVLSLGQNDSSDMVATLGCTRLTPVRVNGWATGWVVPAGASGRVQFSFPADRTFAIALGVGGLLALVVLALALWRPRRGREVLAPLTGRPVGLLELAVAPIALGLVAGWWGLAAGAVASVALLVLRRRVDEDVVGAGVAVGAGLSLLVAVLGLAWAPISSAGDADLWTQAWSLTAAGLLVGSLVVPSGSRRTIVRMFFQRRKGRSRP